MSTGVTVIKRLKKDVIRIAFSFKGVQCREIVNLPGTKPNVLYAERLRGEILGKIERDTFRYSDYFPESRKCKVFGHRSKASETVRALLEDYRDRSKNVLALSTWKGYKKDIDNILIPEFGDILVPALGVAMLRDWIAKRAVTSKRMSNLLLPLSNALSEAVADEVVEFNPIDRLKLARILPRETVSTDYTPDPYNSADLIALLVTMVGVERHVFQFMAYTGLRTSEAIALQWRDVDLSRGIIRVHRAVVESEEKETKTRAGVRFIPLLTAARQALEAQRPHTQLADGRVFLNPRTNGEWTDQSLLRLWQRTCRKANGRYRNPYQMRHTFASNLLSEGENTAHIAKLLGHKTTEMVMRNYGRWVEQGVALGFDRPPSQYGRECLPGLPAIRVEAAEKRVKNE